jgi:hypothetical protein
MMQHVYSALGYDNVVDLNTFRSSLGKDNTPWHRERLGLITQIAHDDPDLLRENYAQQRRLVDDWQRQIIAS